MATRHTKFARRTSPPNRSWAGSEFEAQTIAANTAVLIGTFVLSNAGIDETVLRTLARFVVRTDQVAATEFQIGALGLIVVSDQAISVGITAVPHPIADIADDGWFVHMPIVQAFELGDNTGFTYAPTYEVDSKAKRVIHDGQSIGIVVENSSTGGFSIAGVMRSLTMVRGT